MQQRTLRTLVVAGFAAAAVIATPGALPGEDGRAYADYPERPIRVIVPFAPGGRTDTLPRMIANKIEEKGLLPQPLVVVNMPGGGGAIGGQALADAEPDGYTIGHWHHQMLVANAMGSIPFGPEDFASLGYTGGGSPVWTVREEAPFDTLDDLIAHLQAEPRSLVEVIGIGTIPHFVGAMLAEEGGFETRKISAQSGADRVQAILGEHADISLFAASEYLNWRDADPGLKALVFFGPNRIDSIPQVPTATELGYDVVWANPAWWLGPKGIPEDRVAILTEALEAAIMDPEIQQYYRDNALDPYWVGPEEAMADAVQMLERLEAVAAEIR